MGMPALRPEFTREDYTDRDTPGLARDRREYLDRLRHFLALEESSPNARPHVIAQRRAEIKRFSEIRHSQL